MRRGRWAGAGAGDWESSHRTAPPQCIRLTLHPDTTLLAENYPPTSQPVRLILTLPPTTYSADTSSPHIGLSTGSIHRFSRHVFFVFELLMETGAELITRMPSNFHFRGFPVLMRLNFEITLSWGGKMPGGNREKHVESVSCYKNPWIIQIYRLFINHTNISMDSSRIIQRYLWIPHNDPKIPRGYYLSCPLYLFDSVLHFSFYVYFYFPRMGKHA